MSQNKVTTDKATIYQGDSLAILRDLPTASVDAVITDPPYSSGGQFRGDRCQSTAAKYILTGTKHVAEDFHGDTRDQRAYLVWCELWLRECLRIVKPGGTLLCFIDWRQLPTVTDAIQVAGFVWRGVAVWDKTRGCRPQKGWFRQQSEYIITATSGPRPAAADNSPCLPGVFTHAPLSGGGKLHQAGKPLPLMRDLVKVVPAGSVILDPFMGSGTTGLAAIENGCNFIGIELGGGYLRHCPRSAFGSC